MGSGGVDGGGGVVMVGVWVGLVRNDLSEDACTVFSEWNIRSRSCWAILNSSSQARIRAFGSFLRDNSGCSRRCLSFAKKLMGDSDLCAVVSAWMRFCRSLVESVTRSRL